jgi:chromosome segregation ATPase
MAGLQIAVDCCSRKDLASLSHEQLLQLSQAQAVENKALKAGMPWLAASRDASIISSKEEAARQATVIAKMQAAYESLHATNSSQAASIGCLKNQASGLQQQLGSAQYDAGKWQASYAALKTQAESKYAALAQESEAVIDKLAAHGSELQQQADKAAAKYAALHTRCAELTSQLSGYQELQSEHKQFLTVSEQVLADYNVLGERLSRRDAVISKQRLQLHQLRGATANTAAASSGHGTAPAAAEFTPAAAAAQEMHRRNERSGCRKRQATPRTLTKSRLSASSSVTPLLESAMPACCDNVTNG